MSVSIGSVGSGSGGGFDLSKLASQMAPRMMSDLDPNNTGKVAKDQFVSGLTSKGVSSADATRMYDSIDTKKTGSIGKSDIEAAIKNGNLKPPSGGPRGAGKPGGPGGPGGAPKAGGSGGPGGAAKAGGASSSSTTYDAADTNKDGVVSAQEALIYSLKHLSVSTTNKADSSRLGQNVDMMA